MEWRKSYFRAKAKLLNDSKVAGENRRLFSEFLEAEENKLKWTSGDHLLDANSYESLVAYTSRLRIVNRWLGNKPWTSLTKNDIQRAIRQLGRANSPNEGNDAG